MNLKELAQELGLSQTTVSRALNGYPEVAEGTRKRVESAAAQFGYRPSDRARSLALGKSMSVGHIIARSNKHEMVNPIFGDFLSGAGETYARHDYQMLLRVVDQHSDETEIYRELARRRTVDGVVVHGPSRDDPRLDLLREIGMPFIVHGRSSEVTQPYSWLDVNNRRAFRRATEFLFDLGHRRIALLNGLEDMDFAYRRRRGFLDAHAERGVDADTSMMFSDEMTEHFGYSTASALLDRDDAPTAILVSSVISAIGVRRAIMERGLVMGRDLSVITYDDNLSYFGNGGDVPIFTSTRSSVREAGRRLAELLLQSINDPDTGIVTELFEAELMVGQSTGPAPQRS